MVREPIHRPSPRGSNPQNPYEGRWRWWYSAIADFMIRNPGSTQEDCAKFLNKASNTISLIVRSDTFQGYLAQRKSEWQQQHDFAVRSKLTQVVEATADALLEKLEKKRDQIPTRDLVPLFQSGLEALGFGPQQGPTVLVQNDNRSVQLPPTVTTTTLEEARAALRLAEAKRVEALPGPTLSLVDSELDLECEQSSAPVGSERGAEAGHEVASSATACTTEVQE